MHATSLPSRGGIGDMGPAAYAFVDWLAGARSNAVADSSVRAGGIRQLSLFLHLRICWKYLDDQSGTAGRAWLAGTGKIATLPEGGSRIDFDQVASSSCRCCATRRQLSTQCPGQPRERYDAFCRENAWWLNDYVLFSSLRERFGKESWNTWPEDICRRNPEAIAGLRTRWRRSWIRSAFSSLLSLSSGRRCGGTVPNAASG